MSEHAQHQFQAAYMSDEQQDWRQSRRCSVEGCDGPAVHQLVSGAWPQRSFFWLCEEHWLAGPVSVVVSEEQA